MRIILVFILVFGLSACNKGNVKESSGPNIRIDEVSIFPEAKVTAVLEVIDGKISSVKLASSEEEGKNTITFSLSEMGDSGMMLSSKSTLDVMIKFDIEMIDYRGKRHYTSSCPLMPGAGAFESWGHKIPELKISNFRVLKDKSTMSCE